MKKIHLDTDLGGDIDDLCALAMLLRWRDEIELTGITTVAEANGRRAGVVRYILGLEGRSDVRVAAGAEVSQGFYRYAELDYPDEKRYWSGLILPSPNKIDEALNLLKQSIEQQAIVIGIGPFTNLCLLDLQYPGILMRANLFLMGGFIRPIRVGYPDWGNDSDWNIQVDVRSAKHVLQNSNPTLIPLTMSVETALRRVYLEELRKSGTLGQLIARQAEEFAKDEKMESRFGETCPGLPRDIINFQHDSLACAIALGWEQGVEIEELPLVIDEKDGWLTERIHPTGKPVRVVTKIDGPRFNEFWVDTIVNR